MLVKYIRDVFNKNMGKKIAKGRKSLEECPQRDLVLSYIDKMKERAIRYFK